MLDCELCMPALTHEQNALISTIESRQGLKIACPEEIAFRQGWIDETQLLALAERYAKTGYGRYLRRLLEPAGHYISQ